MKLDASIDVRAMHTEGVLLDFVVQGKRTRLRLSRRASQQLAIVLTATVGAPAGLLERGIRVNLARARHVSADTIDVPEPGSTGASRAI